MLFIHIRMRVFYKIKIDMFAFFDKLSLLLQITENLCAALDRLYLFINAIFIKHTVLEY